MNSFSKFLIKQAFNLSTRYKESLSILIYHQVFSQKDPMRLDIPTAEDFNIEMSWVKNVFNVLPLKEGITRLYNDSLPKRSLSITFDDGYENNLKIAAPILKNHNLTATFFITSAFIDKGLMWNDTVIESIRLWKKDTLNLEKEGLGNYHLENLQKRASAAQQIVRILKSFSQEKRLEVVDNLSNQVVGLPTQMMMTADQVKILYTQGMDIGGHTHSHPILTSIPLDECQVEIVKNKEILESVIGSSIELFAYPNGIRGKDYTEEHRTLIEEAGYQAALSTARGVAVPGHSRWHLPRFTPWDRSSHQFMARLWLNQFHTGTTQNE